MTVLTSDRIAIDRDHQPRVLGLGGTQRPGSSSELALRAALAAAARQGATTEIITAAGLELPMYDPGRTLTPEAQDLLTAVRAADAIVIASPGYHGGVSGLLKNALDYLQELAEDDCPYLDGMAVGCIVSAAGWQAATTTLASLRTTVHALRGWPTPLGIAFNSLTRPFDAAGAVVDEKLAGQLEKMAGQVVGFTRARAS